MGKMKSIKMSMTVTFLITICLITLLSGSAIYAAGQAQKRILSRRALVIEAGAQLEQVEYGYVIDADDENIRWEMLSTRDTVLYYGLYAVMIGVPVFSMVSGIGAAAAVFYRKKLRTPIAQLQNGIERIQDNDLDFHIQYDGDDELGRLCGSMEKMRSELRRNHKALWESLEQRKLLNASVAHDLRTPLTVLKGYLDYLEKNIPKDRLTEDELMDTVAAMQGAAARLEQYVECVRDIEKLESIEIRMQPVNTRLLRNELERTIRQLAQEKEILFTSRIPLAEVAIDKNVLFRILENLLQNALRYAVKQVTADLSVRDGFLVLTVKDDGRGFSETDLKRAVHAFYSREKGEDHFGVGLCVCRLLCEKHGGSLSVANNKEKGACVVAELKISQ